MCLLVAKFPWWWNPSFLQLSTVGQGLQVPVNLQGGQMLWSVLQLFISLGMENCYTLKVKRLEEVLLCIFQARDRAGLQKVQREPEKTPELKKNI